MLTDLMRNIPNRGRRALGQQKRGSQLWDRLRYTVELLDELRPVPVPVTCVDVVALLDVDIMVMVMRGKAGRHHTEQQDESCRGRGAKLPAMSHTPDDSFAAHSEQTQ